MGFRRRKIAGRRRNAASFRRNTVSFSEVEAAAAAAGTETSRFAAGATGLVMKGFADRTARERDQMWVSPLNHVLQTWLAATRAWALACTDAATATLTGPGSAVQTLPVFTPPALPATGQAAAFSLS